ncbi:hypothetical protein [Brevibacillus porteri]|uniref:hypothetical protein n=1 Tax=Brevibacillus porteri TaxID=2126350 RepID=UPI00362C2264
MTSRKKLPQDLEAEVLIKSKRRCCLCSGLNNDFEEKAGQIAHLDKNRDNNSLNNLAFLCFVHHDKFDSTSSQSKNYTKTEIKKYREELHKYYEKQYRATFSKNDYYDYLDKTISLVPSSNDILDNKITIKVPDLELIKYTRIDLELWNNGEYELTINKIEMKNRLPFHYSSDDWTPLPFKGSDKSNTFSTTRYLNNHYFNFEIESKKFINLYYDFPECRIGLVQRMNSLQFDFQISLTIPSKSLNYEIPDIQRDITKTLIFEFIDGD